MASSTTLEERVAELERLVDKLMRRSDRSKEKDWRRTVGMFDSDEVMKEIIEEGRRIREEDRKKTDS